MAGLNNTWWQLLGFHEHDADIPVLEGTTLTAMFGPDNVHGSGGCNPYGANAKYTPESESGDITISELIYAQAFCEEPPGVNEQEKTFFGYMLAARTFEIVGTRLTLVGEGIAQKSLVFERIRAKGFDPS